MQVMSKKISTKPTLTERMERSPILTMLVAAVAIIAILSVAEFICVTLGAGFDPRIG